jgi:hypothetical protein
MARPLSYATFLRLTDSKHGASSKPPLHNSDYVTSELSCLSFHFSTLFPNDICIPNMLILHYGAHFDHNVELSNGISGCGLKMIFCRCTKRPFRVEYRRLMGLLSLFTSAKSDRWVTISSYYLWLGVDFEKQQDGAVAHTARQTIRF